MRWRAAAMMALLTLTGCGASSLSTVQLRNDASKVCVAASARAAQIPLPGSAAAARAFLVHGVAALTPELVGLRRLTAPRGLTGVYAVALTGLERERRALQSTVSDLSGGADPVVAIRTLQAELAPIEGRGNGAWRKLGIPACAQR